MLSVARPFEVPTTVFDPFFSQTVKITSGTILLKNKIELELITKWSGIIYLALTFLINVVRWNKRVFEVPTTVFDPFFPQTVKITSGTILLRNKIELELMTKMDFVHIFGKLTTPICDV